MEDKIQAIKNLAEMQGNNGNWDNDPYMQGLYNGLEISLSILEGREPKFRNSPKKWGSRPEQLVRPFLKLLYFLERKYYRYFVSNKPMAEVK
jgi:hypothetical protein